MPRRSARIAAMPNSPDPFLLGGVEDEPMEDPDFVDEEPLSEFVCDAERFSKALDVITLSAQSASDKRADIFKLVDKYYAIASERLQHLRRSRRPTRQQRRSDDEFSQESMDVDEAAADDQDSELASDLNHWELETQTWDLLRRLLPLRYADRKIAPLRRREAAKYQTAAALWDEFLQTDSTAKERKAILECLQKMADESSPDIDEMVHDLQQNAERGDIIAYGWLHTRSAIKMRKNLNGWTGPLDPFSADATEDHLDSTGANPLVTQLDPDAVTRQDRKLQPQDEYFERAIWLGCYELLRRGKSLAEIRDWCVDRTEIWRAVSMSAIPLSREGAEQWHVSSPLATLLWRRSCYTLARQGGTDDFERAVYGILAGDILSVEKVCSTWDDFVFAHYNALLRTQFDSYVMKRTSPDATQAAQSIPVFDAVQFYGDTVTVDERLVHSLDTNEKIAAEARTPLKSLQAAIISDTIGQYVYDDGLVVGRNAQKKGSSSLILDTGIAKPTLDEAKYFNLDDSNGLRILAHVFLLISSLEELQKGGHTDPSVRKTQDNVLAAYASVLRVNDLIELLPLYCSKMQGERAFYTLSGNFVNVTDGDDRARLLRIMEKLGMDIAEFVVFQPTSLLKDHPENLETLSAGRLDMFLSEAPSLKYGRRLKPDFLGDPPEHFDYVDERLIQSLEWMMLVDGLWDEIFRFGVAIYKRFLKNYNILAARALSERVRCADIFRAKARLAIHDDNDISWFNEITEESPIFTEEGITPQQMITARNFLELECLVRSLDIMETIASSAGISHDPANNPPGVLSREFWSNVGSEVKVLKSVIQPLLRGWLKESIEGDEDFELLRDMYLPDTILGYVSVLHFAGTSLSRDNLLECMELAALIAEKESDLAAVFMKSGRMEELVKGFANCSKALAITASDKKGAGGGSSKKMRELGWSRELWSVKR